MIPLIEQTSEPIYVDFENWFKQFIIDLIDKKFPIEKLWNDQNTINEAFLKIWDEIVTRYSFKRFVASGGSAIVIKVVDSNSNKTYALKVSHINQPYSDKNTVKNEIAALSGLRHDNIINMYFSGNVKLNSGKEVYFFVMDFIGPNAELDKYIDTLIAEKQNEKAIGNITLKKKNDLNFVSRRVYSLLLDVINAITYIHQKDNNLVHFDIKPQNILVDKGRAVLTDFGSAIKSGTLSDETTVVVGPFTGEFCHQDLIKRMEGVTGGRIKNLPKKDIRPKYDIYAFGKTILYILNKIYSVYSKVVSDDYLFSYIHLAACRMLDGQNKQSKRARDGTVMKEGDFLWEDWRSMDSSLFQHIKYRDTWSIKIDFEKAQSERPFPEDIPELGAFYSKLITDDDKPIPFSRRVKRIVENEYFRRLRFVPQLGLVDTIFPSVTHNRMEHSIGVFGNVCLFVLSLYNDPYNPLFKQLINPKDVKSLLVASLLHDIGHFPLAHEIHEIIKESKDSALEKISTEISHENIGIRLINEKDSLKNILLESEDQGGWGLNIEDLKTISSLIKYTASEENLDEDLIHNIKIRMMASILDGFIDADKMDYYRRDSSRGYLKYGSVIDSQRLITNLTFEMKSSSRTGIEFSLAVYEKGETSAESFVFARYLLYKTLYWHHTARSVRVMLGYVIKKILNSKGKASFIDELIKMKMDTKREETTINNMLDMLAKFSDSKNQNAPNNEMCQMIKDRNYYKRVLTLHLPEDEPLINKLKTMPSNLVMDNFKKIIMSNITNHLHRNNGSESRTVFETTSELESSLNKINVPFLLDIPPSPFASDRDSEFKIVPEPSRISKNYEMLTLERGRPAEVFEVYEKLVKTLSRIRLYAHPDLRDDLVYNYSDDQLKVFLQEASEKGFLI